MSKAITDARTACAKALQLLVYEAATSDTPFIDRSVAESFVDSLACVVLETIAAQAAEEHQPEKTDVNVNGLSA